MGLDIFPPSMKSEDIPWQLACEALHRQSTPERMEEVASLIAKLSRPFLHGANSRPFFRACEAANIHVTPVHFYQPIPDTRKLPESLWLAERPTPGIKWNEERQLALLREHFPIFSGEYDTLPTQASDNPAEFHLNNGRFDGTDALVLYCMVRHFRPARVVEVGSGMSSLLTAQAARKNGQTELTCIEPFPNELLKQGFAGLTQLIAEPVQGVGREIFDSLDKNDILFIDSTHVVQIGGDVNFLFLEILPRLRPGVIVHIHDIFLPYEYPRNWVKEEFRFWTEQYLLQAFLTCNSDFEVLFANNYLANRFSAEMRKTFPTSPWWGGGSFWIQRSHGEQHRQG